MSRWERILLAAGLVAVVGVGELLFPGRPFDPVAWNATPHGRARAEMADRIVARESLQGMARAQVVQQLGEPVTDGFESSELVYHLGPERGLFSIDSEWLLVELDANGRVRQTQIVTD